MAVVCVSQGVMSRNIEDFFNLPVLICNITNKKEDIKVIRLYHTGIDIHHKGISILALVGGLESVMFKFDDFLQLITYMVLIA